jgi:hypothetical protein
MPFVKGQSGNPEGRRKEDNSVRMLAREYTEQAVATLAEIMIDREAPQAARATAANSLLDRGWGKPVQEIDHGSSQDNPLKIEITWQKD